VKPRNGFWFVAAALLTACSGGSHSASVLPASPGVSSPTASSAFTYDKTALKDATLVSAAKVSSLSVDLVPRMQNPTGLLQYANSVNDPHSGMYRHFLTPQEIGDKYGASQASYDASVKYFQSQGLSVATWPQRMLLHVTGSQANMEAALHTSFAWYRNGTSVFLAPAVTPAPPNSAGVVGAANIVMHPQTFTNHVAASGGPSNGLTYGYSPQQIAAAFDYTGAYAAGYTGAGITTGVIGTGGMSPDDVPAYKSMFGLGGSGTVTLVSASDANAPGNTALGFATPPPVTKPCNGSAVSPSATCNPEDGETQLDTEQLASLAPDANLRYYLAYNPNDACGTIDTTCPPGAGIPLQGLGEIDAELQTAIADNHADVLSLSFGGPEAALAGNTFNTSGAGITPLEMAALASEGIAIFVSSGDAGAETCLQWGAAPDPNSPCVSYPATDPNAVGVGGVNTPLNAAGQFVGGLTVWGNHTSGGFAGTGGGVSAYFPLTSYQRGAAGITGSTRNVPDISLEADNNTGVAVLLYGGALSSAQRVAPIGGTSVAAPEAAAMWALVLQACKQTAGCATASGPVPYRLGNPNAYFYKIYANATTYASTFYDVLYGNNGMLCFPTATPCPAPTDPGYSASKGYDLATGIGVPFARALIKTVVGK
jgi:subtilase family serine protease